MNILVIAAHPDDEILGCGATMAKHVKDGDQVYVAILAEGITSRDKTRNRSKNEEELEKLAREANKANQVIGVTELKLYDFPDNRMDSIPLLDIIKVVEELIDQYQPDIVYTHHIGDVNTDHRHIHQAVITACRPIPNKHKVRELLFFEVTSSTEWQPIEANAFTPNWFVDVSDTIDLKLNALEQYNNEMRPWPHARSVKNSLYLSGLRGATIGVEAAEAFMLGRKLL
ncbi:PIG-L deacetylase family protein [Halobacillus sp. Marseille-Q1614]|uniref:PIG-L deacetylase family protein n=1 Tax=Halobacillus sp. Marseille-Q1614 TaxID=2709134 RepID=UPI0020C38BAB|nr:PIG-L family deacetylase [Halobacillus sp. Marseille-Q1614]